MLSLNLTIREASVMRAAIETRRSVLMAAQDFAQRRGDVETVRSVRLERNQLAELDGRIRLLTGLSEDRKTGAHAPVRT